MKHIYIGSRAELFHPEFNRDIDFIRIGSLWWEALLTEAQAEALRSAGFYLKKGKETGHA